MKPWFHFDLPLRRHALAGLLLAGTLAGSAVAAQGLPSAVPPAAAGTEAAPAGGDLPAESAAEQRPPVKMTAGEQVVRAFVEACVDQGGEVGPAIDWALNHGFEPLDPEGRDGSDGHALLGGRPGVVFATPEAATRVLLAVTQDNTCTVWAERAAGTSTQDAFVKALESMGARGAQLRRETDRTLERAGAWRRQLEYRFRAVPGSRDYRLGAVTTLTESPAAQALHLAPLQPARASSMPVEGTRPAETITPVAR
ncbi:NMCC_0638 family (lipo)protein [Caldimonas tepidiphila]|uniref:NMCC_0638 family (lipo)protein n=1 Tax=Caldimonas tepidiphila TaxID=2315841 RepID=UPI000E5A3C62|nr:hypothetical protein [Caldimonas tepidiphila]